MARLSFDQRMFGGAEVLMALRARGDVTPAIATSAEIDALITAQLRSAGFIDIIEKPVALAALERLLGPHSHFSASTGSATTLGSQRLCFTMIPRWPQLAAT